MSCLRAATLAALVSFAGGCGSASAAAAVAEPFASWALPVGEGQVAASSARGLVVVYAQADRDAIVAAYARALSAAGCAVVPTVVEGLAIGRCDLGDDRVTLTGGTDGAGRLVVTIVRESADEGAPVRGEADRLPEGEGAGVGR